MKAASPKSTPLELTGAGLTLDHAEGILRGRVTRLSLGAAARERVAVSRRCLEDLLAHGATLYGVNTGFGKLANERVEAKELLHLQENLLRSHAVGRGPLLDPAVARLALALRVQALARGYSGVTVALLEQLLELFNRN